MQKTLKQHLWSPKAQKKHFFFFIKKTGKAKCFGRDKHKLLWQLIRISFPSELQIPGNLFLPIQSARCLWRAVNCPCGFFSSSHCPDRPAGGKDQYPVVMADIPGCSLPCGSLLPSSQPQVFLQSFTPPTLILCPGTCLCKNSSRKWAEITDLSDLVLSWSRWENTC